MHHVPGSHLALNTSLADAAIRSGFHDTGTSEDTLKDNTFRAAALANRPFLSVL
ncbi:MAG: hypothetical protein L0Z50_42035 [Verrucomicrobiales bacterium]|nr:hypothetical protein [Verrucomicrobiales bacterium]